MQLVCNVTILAIILSGAAVIREREHGTFEHLLVMPLLLGEIMIAKIWANGCVIVVGGVLGVPFTGGAGLLFALGATPVDVGGAASDGHHSFVNR